MNIWKKDAIPHVLITSRGTGRMAHFRNEQTTVAQPAARPTEGYPSVGKNTKQNVSYVLFIMYTIYCTVYNVQHPVHGVQCNFCTFTRYLVQLTPQHRTMPLLGLAKRWRYWENAGIGIRESHIIT